MKFGFNNGPHLQYKDSTSKIMMRLSIALLPIILFSIYKNGILPYIEGYTDLFGALKPLFIILLAVLTSVLTEIIYFRFILKKKDNVKGEIKKSFAIFPGLFLALTLPINTPLWLVIIGAFVATFIGKLIFGGLGYNIFNPALVGSLFVVAAYGALIGSKGGYFNPMELDAVAGATPLSNLSNLNYLGTPSNLVDSFGGMSNFLLGFIPGSLGETSKLLIILGFIFLVITKVIKWIIPTTYVSVVFIMTLIIGLMNDMGIWYPAFHVLSGGLLFGAVFMATDPVTSPTTKGGQALFGLGLGLLTVLFRFLTPYPEGVLTSILTMNMLVFILDRLGAKGKVAKKNVFIPIIIMLILILGLSIYVGGNIKPSASPVDDRFKIVNVEEKDNATIYKVTQKGFKGLIEATITIENDKITSVDITSQHESYWSEIENNNYLDTLIKNQSKIDEVDAIGGATISSNALKSMISNVLKDYEVLK